MNKKLITGIALCGMVAGFASADTLRIEPGTGAVNWNDPVWFSQTDGIYTNAIPSASDGTQIRNGAIVTINTADAVCNGLKMGVNGTVDGYLTIASDGLLTIAANDITVGTTGDEAGHLLIENGGAAVIRRLRVGNSNVGSSTFVLDEGGTMTTRDFLSGIALNATAIGTSSIGGLMTVTNPTFDLFNTVSTMDITGIGSVVIGGDLKTKIDGYITSGQLTGNGVAGFGAVQASVNLDGDTVIVAIPEPATLGLVAAFGGAMLFLRRRFRG